MSSESNKYLCDFYTSVCSCRENCSGIRNNERCPPRGFFTRTVDEVDIMAICKNPGHPPEVEQQLYIDKNSYDIATAHLKMAGAIFANNVMPNFDQRKTRFQRNLFRYLSTFLSPENPQKDVFDRVLYTNLVKCSTHGLQDQLETSTIDKCVEVHLLREIEKFKPKVLVAFGREVEGYLTRKDVQKKHGLEVIYVKHPSYFYKRDYEAKILAEIGQQIRAIVHRN